MATFFYAFEGPQWLGGIPPDWLDENLNECLWLSGEYGSFCDQRYFDFRSEAIETCNSDGKFQSLSLRCMKLAGLRPSIPPEIELLTSSTVILLPQNSISAPISSILPSENYQMKNLTEYIVAENSVWRTPKRTWNAFFPNKAAPFYCWCECPCPRYDALNGSKVTTP